MLRHLQHLPLKPINIPLQRGEEAAYVVAVAHGIMDTLKELGGVHIIIYAKHAVHKRHAKFRNFINRAREQPYHGRVKLMSAERGYVHVYGHGIAALTVAYKAQIMLPAGE